MSIAEQNEVKSMYYKEAIRYMDNAKSSLIQAKKEGKFYKDDKYVKIACGTAYNGVLKAVDGYLLLKGLKKEKGRKSIDYYQSQISKIDKKLGTELSNAYKVLHLNGYYDGITSVPIIATGFDLAYGIIKRIQP